MLAHRTRRAAALLATLAVFSGCDSNPSPAPLPSESPSPSSSSPSPTATPPTLPAAAKGTSEASAKAFARHYFAQINFAARTGDTAQLQALATNSCESCNAIANNIDTVYSAGGSITTDGWKLKSISSVPLQSKRKPIFDLAVFVSPETVVPKAGSKAQEFNGGKRPMTMYLAMTGSSWRVTKLNRVS